MRIQRGIDAYHSALAQIQWGIIHSADGHFIVPDYPGYMTIPISPTICLCAGGQSGVITRQNLAEINSRVKSASIEYYFAQDLALCP